MAQKVKKAVVPVAGLGTRFLPVTKAVPKELLPIVDKPILLHIVEECAEANLTEIIFVTRHGKGAIEDFFDTSYELEKILDETNRGSLLAVVNEARAMVRFISVRQGQALGLGHAVACAHPVLNGAPFALLLGDELHFNPGGESGIGQLIRVFEETEQSTVAVVAVPKHETHKYGIIGYSEIHDTVTGDRTSKAMPLGLNQLYKVNQVVEKPEASHAPSNLALPGRYVFEGSIVDLLMASPPGRNGEIQLTDAMQILATRNRLWGMQLAGTRYDAGDKVGYLVANIEMALKREDLRGTLESYLLNLARTIEKNREIGSSE